MRSNQNQITFHPDVQEYMEVNGFTRVHSHADMVYIKGKQAVLFSGRTIVYKTAHEGSTNSLHSILFQWNQVKKYIGFDGKNIFELFWLLHFMGAITIQELKQEVKGSINMGSLLAGKSLTTISVMH